MSQRYYCPQESFGEEVWLTDSEAHHLLHVMRVKPGAQVEIFNGRGRVATAEVIETSRKKALLRPLAGSERIDGNGARVPLTLITAVPKSDRFRWLVEKATELGVQRLLPIKTERSVVSPRESKLDKQQQYVVEACKQSGRNELMEIGSFTSLEQALDDLPADALLLVGTLATDERTLSVSDLATAEASLMAIFVGPEGGFSPEEESLLFARGARGLSVGEHVLRTETAGIVLASVVTAACVRRIS